MHRFRPFGKLPKLKTQTYDGKKFRTSYYRLGRSSGSDAATTICPPQSRVDNNPTAISSNAIFTDATSTSSSTGSHSGKQQKLLEAWEKVRHDLLAIRVEEMSPATSLCCMCDSAVDDIIHCSDCGPTAYYCRDCCVRIHKQMIFHKPMKWNNSTCVYVPFTLKRTLSRVDRHDCGQLYTTMIYIVDVEGKHQECTVTLCRCEDVAVTLLRYNLWPSTPTNPKIAFDLRFMEMLSVLQLECHLPSKSFCQALTHMRSYRMNVSAEDKDIYRAVVGDCLTEYNFHRSSLNTRNLIYDSTIGRECPICQKNPTIVSMDGNFGLVHKSSSGQGHGQESSRHNQLFFHGHTEIKYFIDSYTADRKCQSVECSNFQAGSIIRSKIKTKKLDVTGVFGSVCKHDVPLHFLDMCHGERLGYPVYVLKQLLENRSDSLLVMYDIACSLHRHLKKNNSAEILQKCRFAVPVFHSFAHNLACQLQYGQRYCEGTGLTDGEGIERLWSYLRGFKKITKEMTINNRQDLLSEAMLHHTEKVLWSIAPRLLEKARKAEGIVSECEALLTNILETEKATLDSVDLWYEEWKVSSEKQKKKELNLTADELYLECLQKVETARENLEAAESQEDRKMAEKILERTGKESQRLKKKSSAVLSLNSVAGLAALLTAKQKRKISSLKRLKSLATDRQYLSTLMKKYADGQGVGMRVTRQFSNNTGQINNELDNLKTSCSESVDFSSVSSPTAPIFIELDSVSITSQQQKAVEALCLQRHAKQEIDDIQSEANIFFRYLSSQSRTILTTIDSLLHSLPTRLNRGKCMYLYNHHFNLEKIWDLCKPLALAVNSADVEFSEIVHNILASELLDGTTQSNRIINSDDLVNVLGVIETFEGSNQDYDDDDDDDDDD